MSIWAAVLVAVLVIPSAFVSASGPNGTLRGFIRSSTTSAAIAGADVKVTATDLPWVFESTADGNGYFSISLPNHLYDVQATSPAYYLNSTAFQSNHVTVGSGQTVWFNMSLDPAASRTALLQGFVKDASNSTPVRVGRIVLAPQYSWTSPRYSNSSLLDASGYYAINVTPDTYQLTTGGVLGYAPYAYSYLGLTSGQVRWLNFSMTPAPLVSWINGTVEDSSNYSRVSAATVSAYVGDLRLGSMTTNATGTFSLRVPVATVRVVGDAPGYAPSSTNVYIYWAGSFGATLYLTPLSTGVHGYVRDGVTGAGIPNAVVAPMPVFSGGYYDQAVTDAAGAYAVTLPPDDYAITVRMPGYAQSYTSIYLSSGSLAWLNITLWPLVSTLRGYLHDGITGAPVPSTSVYAYDSRSGYAAGMLSDAAGFYSLTLPPSPAITVTVRGSAPYVGAVEYVATFPYATVWRNITLEHVDLQLTVTVTDAVTKAPIAGAGASAYWNPGATYGTTGGSGIAVLGVPSGLPLTAYASASGYNSNYTVLDPLLASASLGIELVPTVSANVTVQGYVRDAATNTSITFARITASGYGNFVSYGFTDGTGYYQLSTVMYPQALQAVASGYASETRTIDPRAGETIWLNFTLSLDSTPPVIVDLAATPSSNLGPGNPASIVGHVNESDFGGAGLTVYMLHSVAGNVGTFLPLANLPAADLSVTSPAPGNVTVTEPWDTRSPAALLSDGVSQVWWPAPGSSFSPHLVQISGYWDNATVASATWGTAYFDSLSGNLLYVWTYVYGFITGADQPSSTFQPYGAGIRLNLTTAAIGASPLVTGPTFQLGSLHLTNSPTAPGGMYAAVLTTWDNAGHYAQAATLMNVTADTTPPVARPGPPQTVGQGTLVTLDGSASTDNVGIVNYTWSFADAGSRVLYGPTVTYRFINPGRFVVTLTVRDAAGNRGTATTTVTALDTIAPTVAFTRPVDGANVSGAVNLTATAADNVGVVRVEFLVDGVPLGNITAAPYTLSLNTATLANGLRTLTAVAYDAAGNSATAAVHVTVSNAGSGVLGSDTVIWLLLGLVVAAVAAVVVVLLLRRRRPRVPYAMPPSPPPGA